MEGESFRSFCGDDGSGYSCAALDDDVSWEFIFGVGCWVCYLVCNQMLGLGFVYACLYYV